MASSSPPSAREQTLDEKWAHIEKNETLIVQFQENPGPNNPLLPYSMEIIWGDPENPQAEYYWGTDVRESTGPDGEDTTSEKFVKDLTTAATRATKLTELRVVYYNSIDRIWPYTKVGRIIEVFSKVSGKKATLKSVEKDFFGFTISFSDDGKPKGESNDDDDSTAAPPFDVGIAFSKLDPMRRTLCQMYIWSKSELMDMMASGELTNINSS